jgi:MFS family permease
MAPAAAPALGLSPAAVGYFVTLVYVGSMIGTATAGGWSARFGPIRVSQVGLLLCLFGLAAAASAALPAVILGALLLGLGYGPATPASSMILARATPPQLLALTFSIKQTGVPLGTAIAGAAVPALVLALGWQGAALAIGAACAVCAGMLAPIRARYDAARDRSAPVSLRSAFAPVARVLRDRTLLELSRVSFVADRFAARRLTLGLLGLGMGATAMSALAAGPHWPLWMLFAFAMTFGATAVGWNGVFLAEIASLAPRERISDATGGSAFFTFLGVVVTPPLFHIVLSLTSSYGVSYALFGVPALAVGAWLLLTAKIARDARHS